MYAAKVLVLVMLVGGTAGADSHDGPPGTMPPLRLEDDVSEMQQIVGPPLAFTLGFGIGQAAEGRWHEKGWLFTAGDSVAMTLWLGGYFVDMSCDRHCEVVGPMVVTGMVGLLGLRIWQTVDSVTGARAKNRRVIEQRLRLEPLLAPPRGGGTGGVAGLAIRF